MKVALPPAVLPLVIKYRKNGIIVDTNLLLLYFVGLYNPRIIGNFQRLSKKGYTSQDFRILLTFLRNFSKIVITPHVLTELSNLAMQGFSEKEFQTFFGNILSELFQLEEMNVDKDTILNTAHLPKFGFTDTAISVAAKEEGYLVITDDYKLHGFLNSSGIDSLNLSYLRVA